MDRLLLSFVLAPCLLAQNSADLFSKAPPAVDKALRARIAQFYQLHVDGKYRQAEALVAEDSKDFFYSANKPKYQGFEIKDIKYSDNFTKAKAIVVVQMIVVMPFFVADKPMPVPVPSHWELVKHAWYWYIPESERYLTPAGQMHGGPETMAAPVNPSMPSKEKIETMMAPVRADKNDAELRGDIANSVQFVIANPSPGKVTLALRAPRGPGFEARLDTTELQPGAKATVTVDWKPGDYKVPKFANLTVQVQPINQAIPLHVTFAK
jgi:hypothetical protein